MAIVWTTLLVSSLVFKSSQYIYENDKDGCNGHEKNTGSISSFLTELRKIQRDVDQLRRENIVIRNLLKCSKRNIDCEEVYVSGRKKSGVYRIKPFCNEIQVDVYCDMVTKGGGWTAIQKRLSGAVSFNRTWAEYKRGFGNPHDSYWIGNDVIHKLTKGRNSSLYVSIRLRDGNTLYELYHQFSISDEADNYTIFLGGPVAGTLGDGMFNTGNSNADLSGMYFSTPDRDNDRYTGNCAAYFGGGWWYNFCHLAYLNGPWSSSAWRNPWSPIVTSGTYVTETMMMIKPN